MSQTPQTPTPPTKFGRLSKTIAFWLMVILVPVFIIQYAGGSKDGASEVKYTEYGLQLQADNIQQVTVIGGKVIQGTFKSPVMINSRSVHKFSVKLPVSNSDKELDRLNE